MKLFNKIDYHKQINSKRALLLNEQSNGSLSIRLQNKKSLISTHNARK